MVLVLIGGAAVIYGFNIQPPPEPDVEPETITIAAFNIQIFGRTKRQKDHVMDVLTDIAREFDIVLIQEIRDSSEETAPTYLEQINQKPGPTYAYIRSPRLGRTTSKEAYAYFYNTESIELIQGSDHSTQTQTTHSNGSPTSPASGAEASTSPSSASTSNQTTPPTRSATSPSSSSPSRRTTQTRRTS